MTDLKIVLRISENGADRVDSMTATGSTINNVSKPVAWGNTSRNNGVNGICIGSYRIGEEGRLQSEADGYSGYMWQTVPSDGKLDMVFTFSGVAIDSISFYGDVAAGQYPTRAILDEGTADERIVVDDDPIFSIIFDSPANSHTVKFTDWNRPNYNACLTNVEIFPHEVTFDKYWVDNIESFAQATPQPDKVSYGSLADTGSIRMVDRNGELRDYSEAGFLNQSVFSLTVTLNGKEIQHHIARSSPYYDAGGYLDVEMTNSIAKWDSIQVDSQSLQFSTYGIYTMLSQLLISTLGVSQSDVDEMCSTVINTVSNGEISVKDYLGLIKCPTFTISATSLRLAINALCSVAQLWVYEDDSGKIKFINARPRATASEIANAIVIPRKCQLASFTYPILNANAYNAVEIEGEPSVGITSSTTNVLRLQGNEFFAARPYIDGQDRMANLVKSNILLDYKDGVIGASQNGVICVDYYDVNGNKVKDYANGDILQIGDIVRIDKDDSGNPLLTHSDGSTRYFRITGRKFLKKGVPTLQLQYMEVIR